MRLAARPTTPPTVLRALANDPSLTVRAAVAMNPAHAPGADRRLLSDRDERIRALLARKMARLLPGLSRAGRPAVRAHVQHTLCALARDAAVRVRAALADALSLMPDAPREVILLLAHDSEATVSSPVVRCSPVLSDADLIGLLTRPAALASPQQAIASRSRLSPAVADHIAAHGDDAAIRALLENESASIRETTLDALIKRAANHPDWHEPLLRRPALPAGATKALSGVIAGHALNMLLQRADVPDDPAGASRTRLASRLRHGQGDSFPAARQGRDSQAAASGNASEAALIEAASSGDISQAAMLLAEASGAKPTVVKRAMALRSAKALVSLTWKAGFSMQAAETVQSVLGRLDPADVMTANADGGYPLPPDEMGWQIELLKEVER